MAATMPVVSTGFKAGRKKQKTFSLEFCLDILEEKLTQSLLTFPKSLIEQNPTLYTLAFTICRKLANLAARKPGKVND